MSLLNEVSTNILKQAIDVYEKLKQECSPNNRLELTKDKVFQISASDDNVVRKTLFLKVCFIHWLQVNANENVNELYFKTTSQRTTIGRKKLIISVDNKRRDENNLTCVQSCFTSIKLEITKHCANIDNSIQHSHFECQMQSLLKLEGCNDI